MGTNADLARLSDVCFQATFLCYVLAQVFLISQYAINRTSRPVLVGAGAPLTAEAEPSESDARPTRSRAERLGNMAIAVLVVGAGLHAGSIALRGFATDRFPLGNMYEFISMACLAAISVALVFARGVATRAIFSLLLVAVLVLMFLAGTVLYADAAPVMPALESFWLPIHVTIICTGSGILLVSGVASMLFLVQGYLAPATHPLAIRTKQWLPTQDVLDRLAYRTAIIAFPLFGVGVVLGAIWAEAAWGRFWGWDPKETTAFITWIIYAGYLHARATAGWRQAAAWVNVAGTAAMLVNLFVINIVVRGLHSYAGLN